MAEELKVNTFEDIASVLSQLATNYSSIAGLFYAIFYDPTPQNITFQMYDESGVLKDYTVKNLALSNLYRTTGDGVPEGKIEGDKGTLYQDLTNGEAFIKMTSGGKEGWYKLINQALLDGYIIQGNVDPNGEETDGNWESTLEANPGTLYVRTDRSQLYIRLTEPIGGKYWEPISASVASFAELDLSNVESIEGSGVGAVSTIASSVLEDKTAFEVNYMSEDNLYPTAKAVYDYGQENFVKKNTVTPTGTEIIPVYIKADGTVAKCSREIPDLTATTSQLAAVSADVNNLKTTKTVSITGAVTGSNTINLADSNSISIETTGKNKTISLTGAVNGSATLNTGNSNSVSISTSLANTASVDGQWVNSFHELSTAKAKGTYNINISSYLPSGNNYKYEVQLIAAASHSGESTKRQAVKSSIITQTTGFNLVGAYADRSRSSIILPVGTDKIITYEIDSTLESATLYMIAYRRMGTNT